MGSFSAKTLPHLAGSVSPQGAAPAEKGSPPFLSTELPQGETGISPPPPPEALLLGGGSPQAVTLWTVCAIMSTKDLCWGIEGEALGDP